MQVSLEKPITWLKSERDGERNRLMYDTLTAALNQLGATVREIDTYYGNDFAPRTAPPGGVLFSYHSVGHSKHVWRIKETPIPYFYNIDRLGYSGWSELAVNPEPHLRNIEQIDPQKAEDFRRKISDWLRTENLSKYRQKSHRPPLKSGFIFFPLQIRSDAVAVHNKIDPLKVLRVAAHAAWSKKKPLIIKRHPYCTSTRVALSLLGHRLNPYVWTTTASVAAILPTCDAVLVGNSGVGLEALVHGKPVYSFAHSEYEISSFKIDNADDIKEVFCKEIYSPHQNSDRFVSYFLQERCFDARSVSDTVQKIGKILEEARK